MTKNAVVAGLLLCLGVSASAVTAQKPGDSCALLQAAEIQLVRQGLLASARAGTTNTAVLSGIGDAAIYESDNPIRVKTTALARGNMLIVSFESSDARAKKDQVIALLKAAAGRL